MRFVLLVHNNKRVVELFNENGKELPIPNHSTIAELLYAMASTNPDRLIVWAHQSCAGNLDRTRLNQVFPHKLIMASFSTSRTLFFGNRIGYVEQTPFVNISFDVPFPTWQMSSDVGGIYTEVLLLLKKSVKPDTNFSFFLNNIAKSGMAKGLFCYSNPKLVKSIKNNTETVRASTFELFRFVKRHYKTKWLFMLWFCMIVFERRFSVLPLLTAFFSKKVNLQDSVFKSVVPIEKASVASGIDVIIPTLGRKKYLLDFLNDLSNQTKLPQKIIIIEQNPLMESHSELNYLHDRTWPFEIDHTFTHQTGACNARNIALKKVTAGYVFFADDDLRIAKDFIQTALNKIFTFEVQAATFNCLMPDEKKEYHHVAQTTNFGSGCSIVEQNALKSLIFNELYEHGYGEDVDFGMQLRCSGTDVVYFPHPEILHLKAPTGGFRYKHRHPWENEAIQPKPSPTVMHFKKRYFCQQQLDGFRVLLYLQFYKDSPVKNPFGYIPYMNKRWNKSLEITNSF